MNSTIEQYQTPDKLKAYIRKLEQMAILEKGYRKAEGEKFAKAEAELAEMTGLAYSLGNANRALESKVKKLQSQLDDIDDQLITAAVDQEKSVEVQPDSEAEPFIVKSDSTTS